MVNYTHHIDPTKSTCVSSGAAQLPRWPLPKQKGHAASAGSNNGVEIVSMAYRRRRPCYDLWPGVLLSMLLSLHPKVDALACKHSGMCSAGHTRAYIGDITTTAGFRAALEARSFNKEIIVMVTTENQALVAKLAIDNFARLGMEHILLIGMNMSACEHLAATIASRIGCAWEAFEGSNSGHTVLWRTRYRVLARAVRMGYNVLSTDGDITVFHDFYRFVKSQPFNKFSIINQPEALWSESQYNDNTFPNGGIIYVQNAKPDGPAAYLLAETVDRYLRWVDDDFKLLQSKGMDHGCGAMDQDMLQDALSSLTSGRPQFHFTVHVCWNGASAEQADYKSRVQTAVRQAMNRGWVTEKVAVPHFMHTIARDNQTQLRWLPMKMPHTEGAWPEEYGGKLYPDQQGNLSSAWQQLLKEACDGCPLWPDPEDVSTLAAARATPQENYLFAPPWLIFGYWPRGSDGSWLPDLHGMIHQVIGHSHYLPGTDTREVGKQVVKQSIAMFDWRSAHTLAQEHEVFFANQWSGARSDLVMEKLPMEVPRVLVLHPHMHLDKLDSFDVLFAILSGAMQVATLSNRTLVWPDVPCNLSLVGSINAHTLVVEHKRRGWWYPYGMRGTNGQGLACMLTKVMVRDCLFDLRGMLGTEWLHYKERHGVRYEVMHHADNTAFVPTHEQLSGVLHIQTHGPGAVIVEVSKEDAANHLASFEMEQVLFLAHPVQIMNYEAEVRERYKECLSNKTVVDGLREVGEVQRATSRPGRMIGHRLELIESSKGTSEPQGSNVRARSLRSLLAHWQVLNSGVRDLWDELSFWRA